MSVIARKKRVAIVADCDYVEKPLGGIVSLLNNMLSVQGCSCIDFWLIGISFDTSERQGVWQQKTIGKNSYHWMPVVVSKKEKDDTRFPMRIKLVWGLKRYSNVINFETFDAIYTHSPEISVAIRTKTTPVICHVHSDPLITATKSRFPLLRSGLVVRLFNCIIQRAFDESAGIIWAANACRNAYYQELCIEKNDDWDKKAKVIYSSVDPVMLNVADESASEASSCSKGIVTVSRLSDVKHIDFLINVYYELRKSRSDIAFFIVSTMIFY